MSKLQKAAWHLAYEDGGTSMLVRVDTTSDTLPDTIWIEGGGDNWLAINPVQAQWLLEVLGAALTIASSAKVKS